jgi:hypothetical protein
MQELLAQWAGATHKRTIALLAALKRVMSLRPWRLDGTAWQEDQAVSATSGAASPRTPAAPRVGAPPRLPSARSRADAALAELHAVSARLHALDLLAEPLLPLTAAGGGAAGDDAGPSPGDNAVSDEQRALEAWVWSWLEDGADASASPPRTLAKGGRTDPVALTSARWQHGVLPSLDSCAEGLAAWVWRDAGAVTQGDTEATYTRWQAALAAFSVYSRLLRRLVLQQAAAAAATESGSPSGVGAAGRNRSRSPDRSAEDAGPPADLGDGRSPGGAVAGAAELGAPPDVVRAFRAALLRAPVGHMCQGFVRRLELAE